MPNKEKTVNLDKLLEQTAKHSASDLFIKVGVRPSLRIDGKLCFLKDEPVTAEAAESIAAHILNDRQREIFDDELEIDVAFDHPVHGRFRVNLFHQQGKVGVVLRRMTWDIPTLEELNLPAGSLMNIASTPRGLFLVSGVAGRGKSTTLASMVDYINQNFQKHVISLEDPIEYVYRDSKCVIEQREIGLDTRDFHSALKHCVRQSPDVILIGELRDRETMEAAVAAAETGHLVFSTLHTTNASQTLERVMNFSRPTSTSSCGCNSPWSS